MAQYDVWATPRLKSRVLAIMGEGVPLVQAAGEDDAVESARTRIAARVLEVLNEARAEDYEAMRRDRR